MAAIGRSPYSGQPQMGMPPLDDEFMNDYEPDPAPPVHSYYPNGYDDRSDLRVPMHGLAAAPGSPMIGSSPVPIEPEGHDDSPPGLYVDDNYGDSPVSYGGNGSLSRWNGNMSVYSGGGGGGDLRGRSPMQNRNEVMWDEQTVTLRRQAKYGFGLAVSGGRDNPHYQSGETSIVVSDVLAQGPAQNRLKINDRLLIVNGQSMENVYHKAAVDALRQAGNTVTITFKRKTVAREPTLQAANYSTLDAAPKRTPAPVSTKAYQSLPRNLTQSAPPKISSQPSGRSSGDTMDMRNTLYLRKKRTEGYGMQLGWVLFVQGLSDQGIASSEGVKQGDTINKINNIPVETLSYADARKLIQASKDKLMLEISRNRDNGLGLPPQLSQNNSSSFETPTSRRNQPDPMQDIFVPQPMPDDEPIVAIQSPPTMAAPPRPPLPSDSYDFDSRMPPRPPSPGADAGMGIPEEPEGDERRISFYKGSSVGLRLLGGNEVGIYVTAIQPTSPAENSGVRVADRIVEVNDTNLLGKTKEDVVMMLLGIVDEVHLVVRSSDLAYRRVRETGKGDKFFIRAHFDYRAPSKEEMSFKKGTVFRILDTMPDGNMGHWYAIRLDRTNQPAERGIIPNNNRAEQLHSTQVAEEVSITTKKAGRAAVFQRRGLRGSMMRKAKSLNKDHWDEIVFGGAPTKFPAYERVVLRESGFIRPVVIFGPIADLTRDQLLQDEPDTFETPLTERTVNNTPGEPMRVNAQGSIKIHAIRDIMDKGKHCLLDITPNAVEQLNYAQCYPIVIFLNADGRSVVKEVRGQFLEPSVNKGSRKYYQTGKKLKKHYLHTFTAMIPITSSGSWYRQIQEAVKIQQNRDIWMSETRSNEPMLDDIQLPMIGPLTLPPDYESDAESVLTVDSRGDASFFTSEAESDFDMEKSPADPDKESESYSFKSPESPVEKTKTELPESVPPDNQYSTDEEGEVDDDERSRRKKRRPKRIDDRVNHNTPKDDRNSSGRPRSRSRSRSRDRRSEVAHLDAEEDEKTISAEQREKYAQKLENSWTASARPSRKDMMKKREDMKRSASQSRVDGEGMENGHMENDQPEGMIKASVQVNVESAPPSTKVDPYKFTRSTDMPREDRVNKPKLPDKRPTNSGIQLGYNVQKRPQQMPPAPPAADSDDGFPDMPIPGMQQQQQQPRHKPAAKNPGIYRPTPFADGIVPSRSNLTESAPPPASFRPYESTEPPRKEVKETTFGADDDDDDDFPPIPTGLPSGLPSGMPSGLPTGLPPANFQANIHMNGTMPTKETTFDADLEDDEPLVAWSFPSEEVPSRLPPSPPIPEDIPHRQPPPPPVASKPEVYAKPPEPVYAKVQKEPVRDSPPNWRPESPPRNDSPPSWRPESPPHNTQPARTESPYSRVDDFPEPPPNLVSVKSSFVESAPPLAQQEDDDDYRNALRNASKKPRGGPDPRRQSPYGWAPSKENRSQQREQWFNSGQPAKKETTFGAPSSHERINNNNNGHHSPPSVDLSDLPKSEPKPSNVSSYPYDRQSYKAYRDTRAQGKHRSKSPGRMYQESSIYAPKGWKGRSPSPFTPIPVSEEALNANEGHEIVAMARGVFDHNGGCLSSVETGVSIVIPKGAIPEGIKQEVYFKVCKDTNNLPPLDKDKGETLLSPLVMCGPHGLKWLQPVELRLPHRASKTPDGWSFNLKSSDSPTDGQQSNWRNMVIPGMEDSQCQVNANSVSVLVDHF